MMQHDTRPRQEYAGGYRFWGARTWLLYAGGLAAYLILWLLGLALKPVPPVFPGAQVTGGQTSAAPLFSARVTRDFVSHADFEKVLAWYRVALQSTSASPVNGLFVDTAGKAGSRSARLLHPSWRGTTQVTLRQASQQTQIRLVSSGQPPPSPIALMALLFGVWVAQRLRRFRITE
ncbi:MAG: hypothetical protein IT209_02260 [Armatimonadetes bacterium]|nr:hypothetical protein [Armatimonadota bacterium]